MKKYLISLEKDVQRRKLFFSQPDTSDFEVFNAINTMELSQAELEKNFDFAAFKKAYRRDVTKGEIGCTLSHLNVYKKVTEDETIEEEDYVLICEDDALFAEKFNENLTALLRQNLTADIILAGQSKIPSFDDKELAVNYPTTFKCLQKSVGGTPYRYAYPYQNYFAGTVAYLIKKSACRRFGQEVERLHLAHWLADDFILFGKSFGLDILVVRPLMAIENPNLTSNLEALRGSLNNNMVKKLIKFPLKKLLAIKRNL
ncbi:Lsg locus protein 4 [Actinobacillus succinogenes]|uniref:Glycosyl transferase family 25 n=1 Tax=Actinobacillus succinogenes (strain ATCC 55618 / DSM 22257 / CCUG 43843 / 130Z) TaxID=339671 RepID=A6VNZ6_ACTSZ|nr:glycosyltransferase family 25 protein [Actinobacillus succinogenes]ABR74693.1 glycosyl transferase family 25 [Actinobacillus succinogenes 130Z]PHI40886.1 Lsg locus protein 4 [Actinobacillus succinogenes]